MWLHASPKEDLDKTGIDPNAEPLISRRVQQWVYLGSREYLFDQYFNYAPKLSYYIYEVDVRGLPLDDDLAGDQVRTPKFISAERVKLVEVYKPSG